MTLKDESSADDLLERLARRDEQAFGEMCDRFAANLLGAIQQIVQDRTEAGELAIAALERCWNDAPKLAREGASLAAALTFTAHFSAVSRVRASRGLPPSQKTVHLALQRQFAWLPHDAETAIIDQRRELLRKVMAQLPESQREALELALYGGYTESEIAERIAQPLGRVKAELRGAMGFLRHRLRAVVGIWAANI